MCELEHKQSDTS